MTRGRKPKPTSLKKLGGNAGHRSLDSQEPAPNVPERVPYAPRWLGDDAKAEWRRMVKALMKLGLYTDIDRTALEMYCQAYGRWLKAELECTDQGEVLRSEETGNLYQNPWYWVANREWEKLRKMLPEFGLTPSARTRLHIDEPEEVDELAELLFKRRAQVSE